MLTVTHHETLYHAIGAWLSGELIAAQADDEGPGTDDVLSALRELIDCLPSFGDQNQPWALEIDSEATDPGPDFVPSEVSGQLFRSGSRMKGLPYYVNVQKVCFPCAQGYATVYPTAR